MRTPTRFNIRFQLRRPFLWAGLALLALAIGFTLLRQPIRMKTIAAPAVEPQALATPSFTPSPTPVATPAGTPEPQRYVWVTVREKPTPTPKPPPKNQPPTVILAMGAVTPEDRSLMRESATTVCAGDKVSWNASATDPDGDTLLYRWSTSGGRVIGEGPNVSFDTAGLAPGEYTVRVEVDDGCTGVAFEQKTIRISTCRLSVICFEPNLKVESAANVVKPGDMVLLSTNGVSGGHEYGEVKYDWKSSAGTLNAAGSSARLDTTGVTAGAVIEIGVTATSTAGNCTANGAISLTLSSDESLLPLPASSFPNEMEASPDDASKVNDPSRVIDAAYRETATAPLDTAVHAVLTGTAVRPQRAGSPCTRMMASSGSPGLQRKRVPVRAAPVQAPPDLPPTPPEPPSQYREKATATYPERLEVDVPGKITVQFGSEFVPAEPMPSATLLVEGGTTKSTIYPMLEGRQRDKSLPDEMGAEYSAWIKTVLTEAQASGIEVAAQSPEWQELKRGQNEMLTWDWAVTARLPVVAPVLVARIEIEWRKAGASVSKVIVPRFELPIIVADPLLNQEQLKTAAPLCYASSAGLFGLGILPGKRRRKDGTEEDSDEPELVAVRTGPTLSEADDLVQCSVFAPLTARREDIIEVRVFAHLQEQAEEAAKLAAEFAGSSEDAKRRAVKTLSSRIARGTELKFELQMNGLVVEDAEQTLTWIGQPESVAFPVTVPADCRLGNVAGKITVSYDLMPVGHITFMLKVVDPTVAPSPSAQQPAGMEARSYKMVFLSYASGDRDQVIPCAQTLERLNMKFFQDVVNLKAGDKWEPKLYEYIEKSDLFLLFWSENAKQSEWVMKEVRHALKVQQGMQELPAIKPVLLEAEMIAPPPELAHLHFNDQLAHMMNKHTRPQ